MLRRIMKSLRNLRSIRRRVEGGERGGKGERGGGEGGGERRGRGRERAVYMLLCQLEKNWVPQFFVFVFCLEDFSFLSRQGRKTV